MTVVLHLLRVRVTGVSMRSREINGLVGLGSPAVTFGLVFTGSMLNFDQEGLEARPPNQEAAECIGGLRPGSQPSSRAVRCSSPGAHLVQAVTDKGESARAEITLTAASEAAPCSRKL